MSHMLRSKSFAALSLVLISSGLIAVACGSDKSTSTDNVPLTPGGGTENPANPPATNTGGTSAQPDPSNPNPPGDTPSPTTPGSEGPMGNIPVEPGEMNPPGETPPGETPVTPPDVSANCAAAEGPVPNLSLELVAGDLNQPLYVTQAPGDDTRLFVMEKGGTVRVVLNGEMQDTPFITQQVANGGERGLLGMAFHPDFQANGLVYLHFSSPGGDGLGALGSTVVAEYAASGDRSVADPASRRIVFTLAQPAANHNGGELSFGPDKMLYLGLGDGGNGDDQFGPIGNGQNLSALLGKILRFDPLGREVNDAYSVPAGNLAAVTGQQALPEIWAYGLRNPWRFSFDACTGDLYIGDVGQRTLEEIDFLAARADRTIPAGANFGWRLMEGENCRPGDGTCNAQTVTQLGLTQPVDTYGRMIGQSVTGGYVYRGTAVPGLRGHYIYADYQSARFFRFRIENGAAVDRVEITDQMRPSTGNIGSIASFGTDNSGEMYVATFTPGAVYRVVAAQ